MVGGRDFEDSKFNRAIQARRHGSTFKPIVYSAAVEQGYALSHVMVDDSFTFYGDSTQEPWTPQNYDGKYKGPMTLRRLCTCRRIPSPSSSVWSSGRSR